MPSVQVVAPAKVNLFLHITGRRPNGYHELESLFVFTRHGDIVTVQDADEFSLTISGPFASKLEAESDNLVLRAARALQAWSGCGRGAAIHLEKNLPIASGIGGGSSDAAATLKALAELWSLKISELELANISLELGADVPACLSSRAKMVRGIGEVISNGDLHFDAHILLVNPGVPLSTPTVFGRWAQEDNPFHAPLGSDTMPTIDFLSRHSENSLQRAAETVAPVISECVALISEQTGCELARMSGSGATCFGLFESTDDAQAAAKAIRAAHPDWWVQKDQLAD